MYKVLLASIKSLTDTNLLKVTPSQSLQKAARFLSKNVFKTPPVVSAKKTHKKTDPNDRREIYELYSARIFEIKRNTMNSKARNARFILCRPTKSISF
jgi:hypothetical protein